ncbi:MAG: TraR/DksA C4-type zinc finger protein [Blastocatellia bacterium]
MQEYDAIRQQLQTRYDEIQMRLSKIRRDVQHQNEPPHADFAEQATERENDEVLDALDHSIRAEMQQIQVTLKRLEAGEYGICENCEKKIPLKRLAALPHASRCVACAENA